MDDLKSKQLLEKYQQGICTPEEKALLDQWYLIELANQKALTDEFDSPEHEQILLKRILKRFPNEKKVHFLKQWYSVAAAAAIVIFISVIILWKLGNHQNGTILVSHFNKTEIVPGGNNAILTLSNGQKVLLNSANNGLLAHQGASTVNKVSNGTIAYNSLADGSKSNEAFLNTVTTPRGGQFAVILPDGSKVFLNAASSITFPTKFSNTERKITLTGEAYFEVTHDSSKPFKVSSNGQTVEVLGTHFNINAYTDEPKMVTTLLEGSVRISIGNEKNLLKPGQQATIISANKENIKVTTADIDEAVAWKNGLFNFEGDNIDLILRKLARWYDVDIDYSGPMPNDAFVGTVSRSENISEVLKTLALTGKVHFKILGRVIHVSK